MVTMVAVVMPIAMPVTITVAIGRLRVVDRWSVVTGSDDDWLRVHHLRPLVNDLRLLVHDLGLGVHHLRLGHDDDRARLADVDRPIQAWSDGATDIHGDLSLCGAKVPRKKDGRDCQRLKQLTSTHISHRWYELFDICILLVCGRLASTDTFGYRCQAFG